MKVQKVNFRKRKKLWKVQKKVILRRKKIKTAETLKSELQNIPLDNCIWITFNTKKTAFISEQTHKHYGYRFIAFTASNAATMRETKRSKYAEIFVKPKFDFKNTEIVK